MLRKTVNLPSSSAIAYLNNNRVMPSQKLKEHSSYLEDASTKELQTEVYSVIPCFNNAASNIVQVVK